MYHDSYQVYELLDKWNPQGPPVPDQVEELFRRNPPSARQEFLFGQTLLHKCMEHYGDRLELVATIVHAYPEALTKADANGFLPIHRALISGLGAPTLELMKLMVEQAPETLLEATPVGSLPLHLACARQEESAGAIAKFLVDCFPDAIQHRDNNGKFPLHYALDSSFPQEDVVELLVQQYPVLLSFLDEEGFLPLHNILRHRRARFNKVVDLLAEHCPGALHFQDLKHGQTPLLQACQDNNSLSQVYSLVRKWPEQVTMTYASTIFGETGKFNGEMLSSGLLSKSATLERLKAWVALHPDVVSIPDLQGRLPLHYAAVSPCEEASKMARYLLDRDDGPASCEVVDLHGRLPLHYACAAANSAIVELLMDGFRDGLVHADQDNRLPWHYAECARQDLVYDRTLEWFPELDTGDLDRIPHEIRWDVIQIWRDV